MDPKLGTAANLEIAVGIEEEVGWLEIAMEDVGRVEGLECPESLDGDEIGNSESRQDLT